MSLGDFLVRTRVGRWLTQRLHRPPIHPGWRHPMQFGWDYRDMCIFCRLVTDEMSKHFPEPEFPDESRVELGEIAGRKISTNATFKRKLDALDPDSRAVVQDAIERIAREGPPDA